MASDIAVDASGNVFVTGLSAGQITKRFVVSTGYDYATIKYDANGVQQWVQRYNLASKNDEAKSLALDASGNVYITGSCYNSSNYADCVTIRYGNDGTFHWLQLYNGPAASHDAGNALAVDGAGNVCVAGYSYNSSGRSDVLTVKYNSGGALLWAGIYDAGTGTQDVGKAMGLDASGNIYVAAETSVPGLVNSDYLTIKYTASGVQAWAARYNGPENGTDYPTAIAVVNSSSGPIGGFGNAKIYVTGYSYGDVVTIKYSQPTVIGGKIISTALPEVNNFRINTYPNPLSSYTNIQYELPADSRVTINVYDALGRKVATPVDAFHKAGAYVTRLDAANLADGNYHFQYTARSGDKELRESGTIVIKR
jgi:hypothetical protein